MQDTTIDILEEDAMLLEQLSDITSRPRADIISELLVKPFYRCPICGERINAEEIEKTDVLGAFTTSIDPVVFGAGGLKQFDCTSCQTTLTPEEIDMYTVSWDEDQSG